MPEEIFRFKQFSVAHNLCAQKVGTDGVLLGAWTDIPDDTGHILDVGTGSGLVALMMAQRSNAEIDAIDLDESAKRQSHINFCNTEWINRLHFHHSALQNFESNKRYDLIVSNPPFFEKSLKPLEQERSLARHNATLNIEDLIIHARRLLKKNGRLSVIITFEQKKIFIEVARHNNFSLKRHTSVKGSASSKIKRVLIEAVFEAEVIPEIQENELIIEKERNHYTEEYKMLTKDFYLKF